jgi:hypothetical protein
MVHFEQAGIFQILTLLPIDRGISILTTKIYISTRKRLPKHEGRFSLRDLGLKEKCCSCKNWLWVTGSFTVWLVSKP